MSEFKFAWEAAAMRNDPMPDGLPLEEQKAFQALGHLYARFHLNQITREDGSREKGMIVHSVYAERQNRIVRERLSAHSAQMFKAVESAANAYAKERTLENADRLYEAIYGLPVRNIAEET